MWVCYFEGTTERRRRIEEVTFDLRQFNELGLSLEFNDSVYPKLLQFSRLPDSIAHNAISQNVTGISAGSRILAVNGETIQHLDYESQVFLLQNAVTRKVVSITFERHRFLFHFCGEATITCTRIKERFVSRRPKKGENY